VNGKIAIFAFCCCANIILAQSQPPSPNPVINTQEESTESSPKQYKYAISIPAPSTTTAKEPRATATFDNQSRKEAVNDVANGSSSAGSAIDGNWIIVALTAVLAVIAYFQLRTYQRQADLMEKSLTVYTDQAAQLRLTVQAGIEQSKAMERHINEAARQAEAMEEVAKNIEISTGAATESIRILRERTAQQMRAYISVVIGSGVYQDANNRFEAKPLLVNNGHTPAHKLTYHARAEVRDLPLPSDFVFPLPDSPKKGSVVGPHQNATMSAIVENRVDDALVEQIKSGVKLGLVVWGIVNYEDAFGESHYTKFCQNIIWLKDGSVMGYYLPGHDDAT